MSYPPEIWTSAIKMMGALALVIGLLFVSLQVFKRMYQNKSGGRSRNLINVLASNYVGVKKSVALVEVPGTVLVLGITNDRITLLSELSKASVDTAMAARGAKNNGSFAEHLRRLTNKSNNDATA